MTLFHEDKNGIDPSLFVCSARQGTPVSPKQMIPNARHRPLAAGSGCRGQGFTLIELLIACAVILTICAIAIPSFVASVEATKVARAVGDIEAVEADIAVYQVTNNALPDDLTQIGRGYLLDPWNAPYQYLNHSTMKGNGTARKDRFLVPLNDDYDLYSMGKDGASVSAITAKPSQDDILRASSGSYVGRASDF